MKTKLFALATLLLALSINPSRADITNGLVLYLPLNETTGLTAFDQSGNGYNATYTCQSGGTLLTDDSQWTNTAWIGGGCKINFPLSPGTTNFLTIPPTATGLYFDQTKHFTLAAWVKLPTQAAGVIMQNGYGGGGEQFDLDISASKYRLVMRSSRGGGATNVTSAANVSFGNWQHIVAVWDGPNKIEALYVNGQFSAQNSAGTPTCAISTNAVTIGARLASSNTNSFSLTSTNMIMDEVRIYNRTLTAADIFELYSYNGRLPQITTQPRSVTNHVGDNVLFTVGVDANNSTLPLSYQWLSNTVAIPNATNNSLTLSNVQLSFSAAYSVQITNVIGATNSATAYLNVNPLPAADTTTGLVGWWKFDDAAGSTTAADSSVNGNNGTLQNFTDTTTVWGTGVTGGALNFNGDATGTDLVAIPNVGTPAPAALDFSSSPTFTLSAWVKCPASNSAAIICKGSGNGGEQYCLDTQTTGFRFFVRNSAAAATIITGLMPPNNNWQHIVAVFDAINGIQTIYTNGTLAITGVAPFDLLVNSHEVSIGNRQSSAVSAYNLPLTGGIDDVRIYNRALTSADIQQLYVSTLADPFILVQPKNVTIIEGTNATFSVSAHGNSALSYAWYENGSPLISQTNSTLVLSNVQGSANGNSYFVRVTDTANFTDSSNAVLTVNTSAPVFTQDLPAQLYTFADTGPFTASVAATGSLPITYRWQFNGVDLQDSAHSVGSHSNVFSILRTDVTDAGAYQVIAHNQRGDTTSTAATLTVQQLAQFYTNGGNWNLRSNAAIANNVLTLTDGGASETRAAWFGAKQYIGAFSNSWIYTDVNTAGADGCTFTIQNDTRGTAAIGGNGSNLGYSTITPSFAFCLNLYNPNIRGFCWGTNGLRGAPPYTTTAPVNLASGDPILVTLVYANGLITATLVDQTTADTFTTSLNVNIPALVGGNTAYVGFTGGDGATTSTQQISNFSQVSLPSLNAQVSGGNILLTWPQNVGGYQLQFTPAIGTPWQPVQTPITLINGFNQATIPASTGAFYQLNLPLQ
jgi:hypothetical protein